MRQFTGVLLATFILSGAAIAQGDELLTALVAEESRLGARLGVFIHDRETGTRWQYQADERFPLSSTFKTLACAALLQRVDGGLEQLDRQVIFSESDLVSYSPVTGERTGAPGMSLGELCAATLATSDNTAGNLILSAIGGPEGLTAFVRNLGDDRTRLDRWETELNEGVPGDARDTTTPAAMAALLEQLFFGQVLSEGSREQLERWLQGNTVGDDLLRAGLPGHWQIADKTGAGGFGSRSIAAVLRPPGRDAIIVTVYITQTDADMATRNAAIANIGRALARAVAGQLTPP